MAGVRRALDMLGTPYRGERLLTVAAIVVWLVWKVAP